MPTNLSNRFLLILVLLVVSIFGIPPWFPATVNVRALFTSGATWGDVINLQPGIDMAGGTTLVYEVKGANGGAVDEETMNRTMAALKQRVDPQGVRNLVWRPEGTDRLVIQMPLNRKSSEANAARQQYIDAQQQLESTNIRASQAEAIINDASLSDAQKTEQLKALAGGSPQRAELFAKLQTLTSQQKSAAAAKNAGEDARLRGQIEDLIVQIDKLNVAVAQVEATLSNPAERVSGLEAMKKAAEGYDQRIKALDAFAAAYVRFEPLRGTIDDAASLKRLLHGSGLLEFHIQVEENELTPDEWASRARRLKESGPAPLPGDTMRWYSVDRPEEFRTRTYPYGEKLYVLLYDMPAKSMTHAAGQSNWELTNVQEGRNSSGFGMERVVQFTFDLPGAEQFGNLTRANVGKPLAIVLDGKVISAPNINEAITTGSGVISGPKPAGFAPDDLNYLVRTLGAGSLPAQLSEQPISEQTVGPQLGADNLRSGYIAAVGGLIAVATFFVCYYFLTGIVAIIAVVMNLVMILGVMSAFNATFTLPGVAGIVLTIGMAVDANVLINERLREELHRGLSLRMAMRNAYDRAFSAIVDSNVTTAITTILLYYFGSEEVKGFGLTLFIGLVSSMFTALYVTKTILFWMIDHLGVKKLTSLPMRMPKLEKALHPNIDWMGLKWIFYGTSWAFILVGLYFFGHYLVKGDMLDIEFASGTSVVFDVKSKMELPEVRKALEEESQKHPDWLASPTVQAQGSQGLSWLMLTTSQDAIKVSDAIKDAFGEKLDIQLGSTYKHENQTFDEATDGGVIVPITAELRRVGGMIPEELPKHVGGVAIVLEDLKPALTAIQIKERIRQYELTEGASQQVEGYSHVIDVAVDPTTGTAVVMASDPAVSHEADVQKWQQNLARPLWTELAKVISSEASLQQVNSFKPQVAGEAATNAGFAVFLSIICIVIYIWVRFGSFKYGSATVVALLHDVLFTIAALGYTHLVADTSIAQSLLIEPFRLNLTVVAAILTIMGYSMNDTVVVFDRIRENRGKFGHLSPQIINDSINQTFSRTVLTSGATFLTMIVMYVYGGPGVHGFTFAMVIGIMVGTYSSVAIAAPILMLGHKDGLGTPPAKESAGQMQKTAG